MSIGSAVAEPYRLHGLPHEERRPVHELLAMVDCPSAWPAATRTRFPVGRHAASGSHRALALQPELVVADEPTLASTRGGGRDDKPASPT